MGKGAVEVWSLPRPPAIQLAPLYPASVLFSATVSWYPKNQPKPLFSQCSAPYSCVRQLISCRVLTLAVNFNHGRDLAKLDVLHGAISQSFSV
jgi:hypothetical protein